MISFVFETFIKHRTDLCLNQFLKALTDNRCEGYGAPVIKTGHFLLFGDGNNGAGLEAGGNCSEEERLVEYARKHPCQLVGTGF